MWSLWVSSDGEEVLTYTQLLLFSVPVPDPKERWVDRLEVTEQTAVAAPATQERRFVTGRCPYVVDCCWSERPQDIRRIGKPRGSLLLK